MDIWNCIPGGLLAICLAPEHRVYLAIPNPLGPAHSLLFVYRFTVNTSFSISPWLTDLQQFISVHNRFMSCTGIGSFQAFAYFELLDRRVRKHHENQQNKTYTTKYIEPGYNKAPPPPKKKYTLVVLGNVLTALDGLNFYINQVLFMYRG